MFRITVDSSSANKVPIPYAMSSKLKTSNLKSWVSVKNGIVLFLTVNSLTQFFGCTLFNKSEFEEDPVARAAFRESMRDGRGAKEEPDSDSRNEEQRRTIQRSIASNEITYGMNMEEVRLIWGEPTEIIAAGDASAGNQKWIYSSDLNHSWKVHSERAVFFENGRVTGWKKIQE